MAEDMSKSGSGQSSTSGNDAIGQFGQSPFGRLKEVVPEKDLPKIFSGVGNQEGGGSPFGGAGGAGGAGGGTGGGGSQPDLPYGGNPFAGDNFWNIFAGGVNPSAPSAAGGGSSPAGGNPFAGGGSSPTGGNPFAGGGSSPTGGNPSAGGGSSPAGGNPSAGNRDPLTGANSQTYGISTTEIPDGFTLRATIDKLIDSRLDKELGGGQTPSFSSGQGQTPSFGGIGGSGQTSSFGGGDQNLPFGGGDQNLPFGGGQIPSFVSGQVPSFPGQ